MSPFFKRNPPPGNVRRVAPISGNIRESITNKRGRLVQIESWAERRLAMLFERDRTVEDYGSQPEIFRFTDSEGIEHTYIPDFIVWRKDRSVEIHEVTLAERRTRKESRRREAAAKRICEERGWRYIVWTEQNLPQETEAANLLTLYTYRAKADADPVVAEFVIKQLTNHEPLKWGELITQVMNELNLPQAHSVPAIGHMLWHGEIHTDLINQLIFEEGAPILNTRIWLTPRDS